MVSLIYKYLNAGVQVGSKIRTSEVGVPQGGLLSPIKQHYVERTGQRARG